MKRILLLSTLLIISFQLLKAQSIFIKSGRNLTHYTFNSTSLVKLQNEIGQTYEFGYTSKISKDKLLYYGFSAGIEDYNASGSITGTNLVWETTYANVKGLGYCKLFYTDKNNLSLKGGLGFATLIYGRQQIDGTRYDLSTKDEFNGVFISPQIGLSYNLHLNKEVSLRLDYDYAHQFSLTNNTSKKLQFIDHSLSVGFSVNLN